ncbi:MAG: acyl-CoA dehydrogenase family protein [Bryobacteraceae bacterium]
MLTGTTIPVLEGVNHGNSRGTGPSVVSEEVLQRCAERAAIYDRENRFFLEDFEELRTAGYLIQAIPKEFGGMGLKLNEVCQQQRRLARRSAPTALAGCGKRERGSYRIKHSDVQMF